MSAIKTDKDRIVSTARGLLRHSCEIVQHQLEMERVTGAHFNLFHIFGIGHYEVSTHSPLLGDLLNPSGSHGQGATFLRCFLQTPGIKHLFDAAGTQSLFDAESARVRLEFSLGPVTETTGGRLDIFIADKAGRQIAIENKIHAKEQRNWVRRYRNGLRDDACLIYLTLRGDKPLQVDEESEEKVVCISFVTTIIKWLEACRKEVATVPIVRESLTQYIHLIQKLTHQNPSSRMNDAIINSVLDREEIFQAYRALRDADWAIRGKIIRDLVARITPQLPIGIEVIRMPEGNSAKAEGFFFATPELKRRNLLVAIEFESHSYRNCFFGFKALNLQEPFPENSPVREAILKQFSLKFEKCQSTAYWPAWAWWTPRQQWDDDVLQHIAFGGGQFEEEILALICDLFGVASSFCTGIADSATSASRV